MTINVDDFGRLDRMAATLLQSSTTSSSRATGVPSDAEWARQAFIVTVPQSTEGENTFLDDIDIRNRYFTSAYLKWTDSSLGGNTCINPFPQFTRYADIREPGLRAGAAQTTLHMHPGVLGMGNYYSESLDDNMQVVHMRFGVPSYNSLTQFFTGFYNPAASLLARTGRLSDGIVDGILKVGGTLVSVAVLPLMIVPMAIGFIGHAARHFMKWPASKFYYLKPSMPTYWLAVSNMVNQITSHRGLNFTIPAYQQENILGKTDKGEKKQGGVLHTMFPGLITESGDIDVFAVANRSKSLQMRQDYYLRKTLREGGDGPWYNRIRRLVNTENSGIAQEIPDAPPGLSIETYLQRFLDTDILSRLMGDKKNESVSEMDLKARDSADNADLANTPFAPAESTRSISDYFLSNIADGSDWVSFRVNQTGPAQDTFSSSTGKSSLADKINNISKSARDIRINFAEGNILPGQDVINSAVSSVIGGIASGLQLSGLAALAGSAFVDIADHWTDSTASLSKTPYSFTLISPYGNPVSQTLYVLFPLCCIMAGALPLATGKQSYTSPFICELYDRGRRTCRLGLITDLSISRGVSNLSFNHEDNPLAIEVSFTVADLSSIVAMPILPGFSLNLTAGMFDPDTMYSDYMFTLSALHLRDITDRLPLVELQWARAKANFDTYTSASKIAMDVANLPGINMLSAFMRGTERQ